MIWGVWCPGTAPHTHLYHCGVSFTLSDGAKKGPPRYWHLNLRGKIRLGETSTESFHFSHLGPSFVHAKHTGKQNKCCFPPDTKLSGLFGEIQQKLFLWEFHLLELNLSGQWWLLKDVNTFPVQCIPNAFRRGSVQAGLAFITLFSILRRRLQYSSGVKWMCSALLLLNISFSLYWLTLLPWWATSLGVTSQEIPRAPSFQEQWLCCSHSTVLYFLLVNSFVLPSSWDLDGWKPPGSPCSRQAWWSSLLTEQSLNQNDNCLRYSPPPSHPKNYIFLCVQTFFSLPMRSIVLFWMEPQQARSDVAGELLFWATIWITCLAGRWVTIWGG